MTRLTAKQVLSDNDVQDSLAVTTLKLNHKALSDINCLPVFKNLEKLDLTFNNLSSLEGLKPCINLKWLTVVQNKLESLKGIEGLSKLTVLNAGKNKLQSMGEIRYLTSLCAVILNDNEIGSICKLDQLKNLNTLVLSRNPIHSIGNSLLKMKSIEKLSFSSCKLQSIDSSLQSCIELKELRLAHNDIKALPACLIRNKKLQNLDLGYNCIIKWSDLKVLNSLGNLRNLNLHGNPIAENARFAKKIHEVRPGLHVLNARRIDKYTHIEKGNKIDGGDVKKLEIQKEKKDGKLKMDARIHLSAEGSDGELHPVNDVDAGKKLKRKSYKDRLISEEEKVPSLDDERDHGTKKNAKYDDSTAMENSSKQKISKTGKLSLKDDPIIKNTDSKVEKKPKKKAKTEGERPVDAIDDTEASFAELFAGDVAEDHLGKVGEEAIEDKIVISKLVSLEVKRNESRNHRRVARLQLAPEVEIGIGGPSTWADE